MPASDYFGGIGAGVASGAVNGALGFGQTYYGYKLNEQAADNADARHRALYNDLYSPQAKMKQLREAGLSVGLMYGGQGAGGQTAPSPQGAGAPSGGGRNYFDLMGAAVQQQQLELMKAEAELKKSQTEGQNIENADDPVIRRYITEKNEAIADANEREADRVQNAYNAMISAMVNIGYYSENFSISKSHGEGQSESESQGWSLSYTDAHGESHNFNIGVAANAQVGLTNGGGGSVNYGKGESSNESHGQSKSENNATSWAKNVSDAISQSSGKSGNKTELFHLLEKFYQQCEEAQHYGHRNREMARDAYEIRVKRYEENRGKQKK